ncbi:DUF4920 domain-containing protein [Pontibacter sp. H259]|uniref:DUF4920 domain-containing protein n=1 Tax=Pontibacter sp. H259 TaxID=3133421 RepID=UPI0030C3D7E9
MNKTYFSALLLSFALYSCTQQEAGTTATQEQSAQKQTIYGKDFDEKNILSVTQLQDAVASQDSVQATVTAEIVESCQSKGCWMDVKLPDNTTMKVTFRDYAFFLPVENMKGKTVVFTGTAKREVVSVEDQRHYAEDAGRSATEIAKITEPREELRFVADGVKFQ